MKLEHNLLDILYKQVVNYNDVVTSSVISETHRGRECKRSIRIIYHAKTIVLYEISITEKGIQIKFDRGNYYIEDSITTHLDIANPIYNIKTLKEKFNKLTQFYMSSNWYLPVKKSLMNNYDTNEKFAQAILRILQ